MPIALQRTSCQRNDDDRAFEKRGIHETILPTRHSVNADAFAICERWCARGAVGKDTDAVDALKSSDFFGSV